MADNKKLQNAKATKNDEFYTEFSTISNEMGHYREQLKGQTVYCNCDDPSWSNFWKYFHNNFTSIGLKKLISTHYQKDSEPSYALIYEGGDDFNMDAGRVIEIKGNYATVNGKEVFYNAGDFRSDACLKLMEEATVISTNPPFSLFREYIRQLVDMNKKFIVIGNQNASHNKDIFPLFKDNKIWYGASLHGQRIEFRVPDSYPLNNTTNRIDENGNKYIRINGGIRWFTNMDVKYRHDGLWHKNGRFDDSQAHCYYEGNEESYPSYYNFDGIDVSSSNNIPIDYDGFMGVPITILDKFNPEELELIGTGADVEKTKVHMVIEAKKTIAYINPDETIAWCTPYTVSERKLGNGLRIKDENGYPSISPFSRIIVRNLHPIKKSDDRGY